MNALRIAAILRELAEAFEDAPNVDKELSRDEGPLPRATQKRRFWPPPSKTVSELDRQAARKVLRARGLRP